jgi:hypothetical protein
MQKIIVKIILTLLFAGILIWGVKREEPKKVYRNAATPCFSCMGLE